VPRKAFGDVGTFVPFVVGYLVITGLEPGGILLSFGVAQIGVGLYYRTPLAVQPMKAIASAAVSQPGVVTAGALQAAGLFTGVLWLLLGLTGAASWLGRLAGRPVVNGLVLGLGLGLALQGIRMAAEDPVVGVTAGVLALALLSRAPAPAMLALLTLGLGVAVVRTPALPGELAAVAWDWRLPVVALPAIGWREAVTGVMALAVPQATLTLGNAVVAATEENNAAIPDRPVTVRTMAISHGLLNVVSAPLGGVPLCHGAGGMAAHRRFGARTGGALIMLGVLTLLAGLGFAEAIALLLRAFPAGVLGVVLLFGSLELVASLRLDGADRGDRYVTFATAVRHVAHGAGLRRRAGPVARRPAWVAAGVTVHHLLRPGAEEDCHHDDRRDPDRAEAGDGARVGPDDARAAARGGEQGRLGRGPAAAPARQTQRPRHRGHLGEPRALGGLAPRPRVPGDAPAPGRPGSAPGPGGVARGRGGTRPGRLTHAAYNRGVGVAILGAGRGRRAGAGP
jgi:MFS superfamily sulfate permease-like transporter